MSKVIALAVADIHLSHTPPVARSAEPDWYAAMVRPLKQLDELQKKYRVPILCAGDVFDRWNVCPELINWAIRNLPMMCAIPGQHDLPYHFEENIDKSAYWTLVEAGTIEYVSEGRADIGGRFKLTGFSWGVEVEPVDEDGMNIAIVHAFLWKSGYEYPGAPLSSNVSSYREKLKGYDVAIFGDNHKRFTAKVGDCSVLNCGCLIPRKIDERNSKPSVGLIYGDGSIGLHHLDVSEDKWIEREEIDVAAEERRGEIQDYLDELGELEADSLDFRDTVRRYVNDRADLSVGARQLLLELIGG